MSTLASTAMPSMSTSPASPGSVNVALTATMNPTVSSRLASRATRRDQAGEAVVDDHEHQDGDERQARSTSSRSRIVSWPSVGPMVFSLTGCGLRVAGSAPDRSRRDDPLDLRPLELAAR